MGKPMNEQQINKMADDLGSVSFNRTTDGVWICQLGGGFEESYTGASFLEALTKAWTAKFGA